MTGHPTCWLTAAGIALFSAAMVATGSAQSDYPSRPVQLIVPYAAGGIADAGMRILADKLAGRLKQAFVVDNRPGAGGIVSAKARAAAPPDGYTGVVTGNHQAINACLVPALPHQ